VETAGDRADQEKPQHIHHVTSVNTTPGRDPTNAASLRKHLKRGGHKEIAKDLDLTEKPDHIGALLRKMDGRILCFEPFGCACVLQTC
jgi:hypothetical protein